MNEFISMDVETANETFDSICQIGIAHIVNDEIIGTWKSYINPEEPFSDINIIIHGITESDVTNAPKFPDVFNDLIKIFRGLPIVHHSSFDRAAFNQACEKYGFEIPNINWLDSAKIVRRAWEQFHYRGYGLSNVASFLDIEFKHHDALEDAIAAAKIVIAACMCKNCNIDYWIESVKKRIKTREQNGTGHISKMEGNPDGILFGETVTFTGAMQLKRAEAAQIAAQLGCNVNPGVCKDTTILVVGTQDIRMLHGKDKSSKHLKAEELVGKGYDIRIISESDFMKLVRLN